MKKYAVSAILGLSLVVPTISMGASLETFEDKLSYSMGFEVGNYFKATGGDIKKDLLVNGIEDAFNGAAPLMTPEEMLATKQEFAQKMQAKQMAELEQMKANNKAEGEAYLAENKMKEGVVVTESGLQYEVLVEGKGDKPTAEDTVKVEYVGTLIDGSEFDSTKQHGEPAQFQVGQVIKGWGEALQLMSVGTKLRLAIPNGLGYGEQGAAPMIQPNSALIFEVELIEIVKE